MTKECSEEDIRSKVVYDWLKCLGLSANEILVEYSFEIQVGRKAKAIYPRTDVLIKQNNGLNLLVVEVKEPSHNLSSADHIQAISYARMVKGNIAPFTILTNGSACRIFDSVTGLEICDQTVPANHPYVLAGMKVSADGLAARMEALQYIISLSNDNLLHFCRTQVEENMKLIKGDHIYSGKKYIPQLYVARQNAWKELTEKMFGEDCDSNLILIVGPPQHGKTCFVANSVEKFMDLGYPCLFYTAVSLRGSLLEAIRNDLSWLTFEANDEFHWIRRINSIAGNLGTKLVIFVDGWNEMANDGLIINSELERLNLQNIKVVLSTTSPSLTRLLTDEADNLGQVAQRIGLTPAVIDKLMVSPLKDTKKYALVQVERFTDAEIENAGDVYEKAFGVSFGKTRAMFYDPFYLRLAAELGSEQEFQDNISESTLVRLSLKKKAARRNIKELELVSTLVELGQLFYTNGRPISLLDLSDDLRIDDKMNRWIEAAILSTYGYEQIPKVDFYYTHELDYTIAYLFKDWSNLDDSTSITKQFLEATSTTDAARSSFSWFINCKENSSVAKKILESIDINTLTPDQKYILTSAIFLQIKYNRLTDTAWLKKYLASMLEVITKVEVNDDEGTLAKLIASVVRGLDQNDPDFNNWLVTLIKFDDTLEELLSESYTFEVLEERWGELRSWADDDSDSKFDSDLFVDIIINSSEVVSKRSSLLFAECCPTTFLNKLRFMVRKRKQSDSMENVFSSACHLIITGLSNNYYGEMCPGLLSDVRIGDELIKEEYFRQKERLQPILTNFYHDQPLVHEISELLADLKRIGDVKDDGDDYTTSYDPSQRGIQF